MQLMKRPLGWWAIALFLVTLALGTAQLIPVPTISVEWDRRENGERYTPAFRVDENREWMLVYIGSRFCGASNNPELPELVETLKTTLLERAEESNVGYSAVGVGIDWLPVDGWRYLRRFGRFDEVVVGRKWSGLGARQFMKETIAGTAATPQVLIYERRKTLDGEQDPPVWESKILARKVGVARIKNWVDAGAPLRSLP